MTTPDTAAVPPERCPICGETAHQVFSDRKGPWGRRFACGADWLETGKWYAPCKYAMDAALRCGATLEPTPREQARDALVAAVGKDYSEGHIGTHELEEAYAAYLATEPLERGAAQKRR